MPKIYLFLNYIFFQEDELRAFDIPDYVINHGIVNISALMSLFQSSKVNCTLMDKNKKAARYFIGTMTAIFNNILKFASIET